MTAIWTTPPAMTDGYLMNASYWNQYIRDNFDYLKGRPVARVSDLDGTVSNTTSTSFTDVTGASLSITTSGTSRLLIMANWWWSPSTSLIPTMTALVDGVNQGDATNGLASTLTGINTPAMGAFIHLTTATVADGAHTVKLQYKTNTGTLTVSGFNLTVMEVL